MTEPDAGARLRRVTDVLSASISAARATGPGEDIIAPQFLRDHLRRLRRQGKRPGDLIITNTRGSTVALSCCGRRAEMILLSGPITPEFDGPVIRVAGYLDALTMAITADPELVSGLTVVPLDLRTSLDELVALARRRAGDAGDPSVGGWIGTPWPRSPTHSP